MDKAAKLAILKQDLQMLTTANDEYLGTLLDLAAGAIQREGIKLIEDDTECDMAVVQYAAYLFRKRALEYHTNLHHSQTSNSQFKTISPIKPNVLALKHSKSINFTIIFINYIIFSFYCNIHFLTFK